MGRGVDIPWVRGSIYLRNRGGSKYHGGSVFNKGVQYTIDVNRPRVQFTMGFKIPYDTGLQSNQIKCMFAFQRE
jgi:hypothetical protein